MNTQDGLVAAALPGGLLDLLQGTHYKELHIQLFFTNVKDIRGLWCLRCYCLELHIAVSDGDTKQGVL